MRLIAPIVIPTLLGIVALLIRGATRRRERRLLLSIGAMVHFILIASFHLFPIAETPWALLSLDPLGLIVLSISSLLFLLVSLYAWGYFHHERAPTHGGVSRVFTPCMLFFLATMTLTAVTNHLGILWMAIEGTTLASAPLIYYHRHEKALEATWKYLLICSVGIALALLGLFFVAAANGGDGSDLTVTSLMAHGGALDPRWLRIGFILVLVGFGTKMGLAPMHGWLPDAHSEAPSPVSVLLSGALLNCAFLGILRFHQVCLAAHLGPFTTRLFIVFGLISLFVAAAFIVHQRDYKRMLAYSSIEHMGILALGVGIGSGFGSLLHAINHSIAKALLFLTAGQILVAYKSKTSSEIHGLLRTVPFTGGLLTIGTLAVLGVPPFAPFMSELIICKDGLLHGYGIPVALYLLALGMVFVGMSRIVLGMIHGAPHPLPQGGERPSWPMLLAPGLLAIPLLFLGIYLPAPLRALLTSGGHLIGGAP
ncbi:MAG: NADH dehydrogenase FAD-containing subunit [Deltaproteobacteria bacterium]|nr:NADH dehydrogenase FAD-containing subunit [Deltaproteobacteria bacterium]